MPPPPGALRANVYFTYLERDEKGEYRRALWHVEGQPGTEPGSVRSEYRHASMAGQSAAFRTSFHTAAPYVRVAAAYT